MNHWLVYCIAYRVWSWKWDEQRKPSTRERTMRMNKEWDSTKKINFVCDPHTKCSSSYHSKKENAAWVLACFCFCASVAARLSATNNVPTKESMYACNHTRANRWHAMDTITNAASHWHSHCARWVYCRFFEEPSSSHQELCRRQYTVQKWILYTVEK